MDQRKRKGETIFATGTSGSRRENSMSETTKIYLPSEAGDAGSKEKLWRLYLEVQELRRRVRTAEGGPIIRQPGEQEIDPARSERTE